MPRLYVDPFLFACPAPERGPAEFQSYIDTLFVWQELRQKFEVALCMLRDTSVILIEANSYPLWPDLERAVSQLNRYEIQTRDVVSMVNSLLDKLPTAEDELLLDDILIETVIYSPDAQTKQRDISFIEGYKRLLMLIGIAQIVQSGNGHILVSREFPESVSHTDVRGEIVCQFRENTPPSNVPNSIDTKVPSCNSPHGFFNLVEPCSSWLAGDEYCRLAICAALYKRLQANNTNNITLNAYQWQIGERFLDTARALGFMHEETKAKMLLRAVCETILKVDMASTHHLRIGKGGESPQYKRMRDSAGAWRRDIDHEYHLHYWDTRDGPEFAAVVVHNDMDIPE